MEGKLFFGLQNLRMPSRNTTMNCWGTPEWKIRKVEPTKKTIWKILEKDIWLMTIHSYVTRRKEFDGSSGKIEESVKILEKNPWVRAHWKRNIVEKITWKGESTGWIRWLEWDNILEIGWTDLEWQDEPFEKAWARRNKWIVRSELLWGTPVWEGIEMRKG